MIWFIAAVGAVIGAASVIIGCWQYHWPFLNALCVAALAAAVFGVGVARVEILIRRRL